MNLHTKFRRWLISLAPLGHLSDTLCMEVSAMKIKVVLGFAAFFGYQVLVTFLSTGVL